MQCPKCRGDNFEPDSSCLQCGFQGDANQIAELDHLQWLLNQIDEWEAFDIDADHVSKLKQIYSLRLTDAQVTLGLRLASVPNEAETLEKAWTELAHLETLFEKVEQWQLAGYFTPDKAGLDPVRMQRAHADALRQRLGEYQPPESLQTDQDKLEMVSFLLDQIDLLASRQWFKSKKEIEKVVVPVMMMMVDAISSNPPE